MELVEAFVETGKAVGVVGQVGMGLMRTDAFPF